MSEFAIEETVCCCYLGLGLPSLLVAVAPSLQRSGHVRQGRLKRGLSLGPNGNHNP